MEITANARAFVKGNHVDGKSRIDETEGIVCIHTGHIRDWENREPNRELNR